MNDYYVNIAKNIGQNDNELISLSDKNFVERSIVKHIDHASVLKIAETTNNVTMFNFKPVSISQTVKNLSNLNVSKGAGYDGIAPKILKLAAENLAPYITSLINDMFQLSAFPEQLKKAEICPLHKKGTTLDKANYRPVSILTSTSKLFEKEIDNQLKTLSNNVFANSLSAYRTNHGTQHVLLQFTEAVKGFLDDKLCAGAVLTDLSKAFDCLPHDLIIAKLNAYNVSKDSLVLIASYLRGRKQRVKLSNKRSDWRFLYKGVPQGSIVGPALFNFFINDLLFSSPEYEIANYADDTTIFTSAKTNLLLSNKLRDATLSVIEWFNINNMQANPAKFQFIIFGSGHDPPKLTINDSIQIEPTENVKLLGVTLDRKLDFSNHTAQICRKAAWQLSALRRIAHYLSTEARLVIFRSYILSNLNYCKVIWHFGLKKSLNKLERLQERGLRIVYNDFSSDYSTLLEKANMKSLNDDRVFSIMVEVYKARKGLSPAYIVNMFKSKDTGYNLKRSDQLIISHKRTTKYGLKTFKHFGASMWNNLPDSIKCSDNLMSFKSNLRVNSHES